MFFRHTRLIVLPTPHAFSGAENDPSLSYRIVEMMKNYDMPAEKNDKISAVIDDGRAWGGA